VPLLLPRRAGAVNARDVEQAGADVERSMHWVWRCLLAGGVVAAIAGAVASSSPRFAVALGVGCLLLVGIAVVLWLVRRERIERLALDPAAYAIPAVARFGARACALRERRRLASVIQAVVRERGHPLELHLVIRTSRHAQQLEALARELASPAARVQPPIAVACRRLITRPVESPLYNPNLPEEDLQALLLRIRAGISTGGPASGLTA
jgi:Zn-dependent alcohol dehydrogenase